MEYGERYPKNRGCQGLVQITDISLLETIIADVLQENPQMLADYRSGKANPQKVNDLKEKLG